MAAARGSEAALVLRKVRRFSMPPLCRLVVGTRSGKGGNHSESRQTRDGWAAQFAAFTRLA